MKLIPESPARQNEFELAAMPHSRSLLRVARRLTLDPSLAEDLVQETLLLAWRSFHHFRTGTNIRAWLFRILFNAFYAQGRKMRARPVFVSLPHGPEAVSFGSGGAALFEAAAVGRALEILSEEHRSVLLLAVVEGFTCKEVAAILSVPIGTVMSRLNRARQALRNALDPPAPVGSKLRGQSVSIECLEKQPS
jgi:RNA polymerase sigma-70 factor, ECF subfamily